MSIFRETFLVVLSVLLTGCFQLNLSGLKAKDISNITPAREHPNVMFSIPDFYKADYLKEKNLRDAASMETILENSGLFVDAIPDTDRIGYSRSNDLYIYTRFHGGKYNSKPGLTFGLGFLSVLTLGTVPFPIFSDFAIEGSIYEKGKRLKKYRYEFKQVTYPWIPPMLLVPSGMVFGKPEAKMHEILMARYTTNLLSDMQRDGIIFKK